LIFDAPTDQNIDLYVKEMKKHNVTHLVRACDPSYETDKLQSCAIEVHEMPFPDGGTPSDQVVSSWVALCKTAFKDKDACIGVHCVAGLGRAPVLVAVALIEQGLPYEDVVSLIREKRRGAINSKQLKWLKAYKPKHKGSCVVM
jgi:protein tyrosine phosphatase type 4A